MPQVIIWDTEHHIILVYNDIIPANISASVANISLWFIGIANSVSQL